MAMCLEHRRDAGELQLLLKQSYCVCHLETDAEALLNHLLHIPPDEGINLWGVHQGMLPLGYGGLHCLERLQGPIVCGDALLYTGPE